MKIRGEFSCPSCGAKLSAKVFTAFLVVFVLWALADLLLMLISGALFQERAGLGVAVRIVLSLAAASLLYWAVFSRIKLEVKAKVKGDNAS
jgi:hypothetical protein